MLELTHHPSEDASDSKKKIKKREKKREREQCHKSAQESRGFTWQLQDLCQGDAVVEARGDDALLPGSPRLQLVHLFAGVQAVFAHVHPVVGGGRDHDSQPAEAADQEPAQLQTGVGHGASVCVKTPDVSETCWWKQMVDSAE